MTRRDDWVSMQVLFALSIFEDAVRAKQGETCAEKVRRHAAEDAQYGMPAATPKGESR